MSSRPHTEGPDRGSRRIRRCGAEDRAAILEVVNSAAIAYRGVIPADRWHEPYMPADELDAEIAAGVVFHCEEADDRIRGVMAIQDVLDVQLIRHAYVVPTGQRSGVGGALLEHLVGGAEKPVLVGTWAAASWAIEFYERHGFTRVEDEEIAPLLRRYWTVSDRQVETSVVLARR